MNHDSIVAWKMQTSKKWSDVNDILRYINIDFIDYDHQILVEFGLKLNQVLDKADYEFSLELINETERLLQSLYDYAVYHFTREELFMENYNLPDIDSHKVEHNYILTMLEDHLDSFKSGKTKLDMKIKYQVMDWLIKHINVVDHNYFNLNNWSENLIAVSDWKQINEIIHLTGINAIDSQHKELTEMAIGIIDEINNEEITELAVHTMEQFQIKLENHFLYEEQFMYKYRVKDINAHKVIHRKFKEQVNQVFSKITVGEITATELKLWILTWWINHINSVDKVTFDYNNWAYQALDEAKSIDDIEVIMIRTGIDLIDQEHLKLMEEVISFMTYVNKFAENSSEVTDKKILDLSKKHMFKILEIVSVHFEHEEKIMDDKLKIRSETHKQEHKQIVERLNSIIDNINSGKMQVSNNLKTMILDRWIKHINIVDYNTFVTGLMSGGEDNDQ